MKGLQRALSIAGLLAIGSLYGCGKPCEEIPYISGEVIKESGTLVRSLEESRGAIFGNEAVKLGKQTYVLTVETDEGNYTLGVVDSYSKPIEALAEAIELGTKVQFRNSYCKKDRDFGDDEIVRMIPLDRIGRIASDDLQVLNN